jgi:hypothetical protein
MTSLLVSRRANPPAAVRQRSTTPYLPMRDWTVILDINIHTYIHTLFGFYFEVRPNLEIDQLGTSGAQDTLLPYYEVDRVPTNIDSVSIYIHT